MVEMESIPTFMNHNYAQARSSTKQNRMSKFYWCILANCTTPTTMELSVAFSIFSTPYDSQQSLLFFQLNVWLTKQWIVWQVDWFPDCNVIVGCSVNKWDSGIRKSEWPKAVSGLCHSNEWIHSFEKKYQCFSFYHLLLVYRICYGFATNGCFLGIRNKNVCWFSVFCFHLNRPTKPIPTDFD